MFINMCLLFNTHLLYLLLNHSSLNFLPSYTGLISIFTSVLVLVLFAGIAAWFDAHHLALWYVLCRTVDELLFWP